MAVRTIRGSSLERRVASVLTNHATLINELKTNFNGLLTKIDADSSDTGGDSDYESTLVLEASDADTVKVVF